MMLRAPLKSSARACRASSHRRLRTRMGEKELAIGYRFRIIGDKGSDNARGLVLADIRYQLFGGIGWD